MSFSIQKRINKHSHNSVVVVSNRELCASDFSQNVSTLKLMGFYPGTTLFVPMHLPHTYFTNNRKRIKLHNETLFKLYIVIKNKITIHPESDYELLLEYDGDNKSISSSIKEINRSQRNLDLTCVSYYPYTLKTIDILKNPNNERNDQITCGGVGGDLYLPSYDDLDIYFGNSVNSKTGYSISFTIQSTATSDIKIKSGKMTPGLSCVNGCIVIGPMEVWKITLFMTSRIHKQCKVGGIQCV